MKKHFSPLFCLPLIASTGCTLVGMVDSTKTQNQGSPGECLEDCGRNSHCPNSEICFGNQCVGPEALEPEKSTLHIEVTPPNTMGIGAFRHTYTFPSASTSESNPVNIQLPRTVKISGLVSDKTGVLSGRLTASPSSSGLKLPLSHQSFSTDVLEGMYSLQLMPGSYMISFQPNTPPEAPIAPVFVSPSLDIQGESLEYSFEYPEVITFSGRIVIGPGEVAGAEGVQISAIGNPESPAPLRAPITKTDASGYYTIQFAGTPTSIDLKVHANPMTGTPSIEEKILLDGDMRELQSIHLFSLDEVRTTSFNVAVMDSDTLPLTNSVLWLHGQTVGRGDYLLSHMLNERAKVDVTLYPGIYTAIVTPPFSPAEPGPGLTEFTLCVQIDDSSCPQGGRQVQSSSTVDLIAAKRVGVELLGEIESAEVDFRLEHPFVHQSAVLQNPAHIWLPWRNEARPWSYRVKVSPNVCAKRGIFYDTLEMEEEGGGSPTYQHIDNENFVGEHWFYGVVSDAEGQKVPNATIGVFIQDPQYPEKSLHLGSALTNDYGEYTLPIAIPNEYF